MPIPVRNLYIASKIFNGEWALVAEHEMSNGPDIS